MTLGYFRQVRMKFAFGRKAQAEYFSLLDIGDKVQHCASKSVTDHGLLRSVTSKVVMGAVGHAFPRKIYLH